MPAIQRPNGIKMSLSDRWLAVGTTGCGKTTFNKALLTEIRGLYPRLPMYVLDSKGVGDFASWPGITQSESVPAALKADSGTTQIWQPGTDDFNDYDEWFGNILHAPGPCVVLVDELSSVTKKSGAAPDNFIRLMKQGRGKMKSVINCTQELAYIPRQVITQTTHIVRFLLMGDFDQRYGNRLVRRPAKSPEPPRYGLYYSRTDEPSESVYYRSFTEFFGRE